MVTPRRPHRAASVWCSLRCRPAFCAAAHLELRRSSTPSSDWLWEIWKRRSMTRSATSYRHTYLQGWACGWGDMSARQVGEPDTLQPREQAGCAVCRHSGAGMHALPATSPTHPKCTPAYLLLPPASRNDPSAEKARLVKQRPLLVFSAVRRSDRRRPPAMSRRPEMVPCRLVGRLQERCWCGAEETGARKELKAARKQGWQPEPQCGAPNPAPDPASVCPGAQAQSAGPPKRHCSAPCAPGERPRAGPKSRSGRPGWRRPAACRRAARRAPARHAAGEGSRVGAHEER